MAMTDLGIVVPLWEQGGYASSSANVSSSGYVIDAASEKAGLIMQAPKTGNISKIGFYVAAHTTGATLDCRVETISATNGLPTGTLFGTNTSGTVVTSATGWYESTLTAAAAVTKGDRMSLVVAQPSSSPGSCAIGFVSGFFAGVNYHGFPFGGNYVSSWASANGTRPIIYAGYDDGTWGRCPWNLPISSITPTSSFNSSSTPDEVGNRFNALVPMRIVGARLLVNPAGDARDFTIVLYDGSSSVLATETFDSGQFYNNVAAYWADLIFDAAVDISTGVHRIALKPTTTSNNQYGYFDVNNTAHLSAVQSGADTYHTGRTDGGAWTDTNTRVAMIIPLVSGFDNGAGGGGGLAANPIRGFVA